MFTILVADDEPSMIEFLEIMLTKEGYDVTTASSAEEAMEKLDSNAIDLVITDISMPKAGGMAVLEKALSVNLNLPVIMITAYASTTNAVEAMKKGAYDYITKPFLVDEIKLTIKKALERLQDKAELKRLKNEVAESFSLGDLLGRSESMLSLFSMIRKVADSRSTALITGESGTGKELVAKAIHYLSDRKDKPFHSINCGAMAEQLLESELFGHQKGAFTGAHIDKKGLLESCEGGTFFLDEVGEAPLAVQVKMLRVLQEREFKRVGGINDIKVDIRVIAATNQDLEKLIKKGKFREDFFYRIDIIHINIPPLRDRKEDIPLLTSRFIKKYSEENKRKVTSISSEAMTLLENFQWRGNVRELENAIERAVVLSPGSVIGKEHLTDEIRGGEPQGGDESVDIPDEGVDIELLVEEMERKFLEKALKKAKGVKKDAAKYLKLSFRSFRYKLQKYDMGKTEKEDEAV